MEQAGAVNLEAQILEVMLRVKALETSTRTADDLTMISIVLMMTELVTFQAELRQDYEALVDEIARLRHQINGHGCGLLRRPDVRQRPESN
ncbi:hypothetical protein ACIBK9_02300 [Nonomuraea sp. NPDC050227]|uniref:hypothetical protein n=1 Tax=Nonomuraea sp. NPDC050227 TaxID=3364360 RepID=UPI00379E8CA2